MPAASQGRIRESWQPSRLDGTRARAWLIVRRTIASLVALALVGICAYALFTLLWRPKTYFVHLTAKTYGPHHGQPVQFAFGDFNAFKRLESVLAEGSIANPPTDPLTEEVLEERLAEMSRLPARGKDTLIVYLTAHGVISDDEAMLLCEPDNWAAERQLDRLPVAAVLERLKNAKAGTKLLLLDPGQNSDNAQNGIAIDTFAAALQREVDELGDPTIWVLTSCAPLERSHLFPAHGRSAFGHFVSEGLMKGADRRGNRDQIVTLDELYGYVQRNVSAWVELISDGNESQTPLLLNSDSSDSAPALHLLSITNLSEDADNAEVAEGAGVNLVSTSAISDALREATPEQANEIGELVRERASGAIADGAGAANRETPPQESQNESPSRDRARASRQVARGREGAQQALEKAWQAVARLESSSDHRSPSVYAPFLWRELLDGLLWFEACCATDLPKDHAIFDEVTSKVARINQSLEAVEQNDLERADDELITYMLEYAPRVPPDVRAADYASFAMVEQFAQYNPTRPIDKKFKEFVEKYDQQISQRGGNGSELALLYGKEDQPSRADLKKYYEFQLIDVIFNDDVPWELAQLALRVRRLGEQTAADVLCGEGWCVAEINAADLLRWEGERHILDQTSATWLEEAKARLNEAEGMYRQAQNDLKLVRQATKARNQLLRNLPGLLRLAHAEDASLQATDRKVSAVKSLLGSLAEVNQTLDNPGSESIRKLSDSLRALQQSGDEVEKQLVQSDTCWQKSRLLATTLPKPTERLQLRSDVRRLEAELDERFKKVIKEPKERTVLNVPSPTELQTSQLARRIALETAVAQLAGYDGNGLAKLEEAEASLGSHVDWTTFDKARQALNALRQEPPPPIESISAHRDLQDATARFESDLPALRRAMQPWLALSPAQRDELDPAVHNLLAILNDAAWYDLLVWHGDRYRRAIEDAPRIEIEFLRNAANQCRQLAQTVSGQPELALPSPPDISIQVAASEVSLQQDDRATLPLTIASHGAEKVWLVVQYNSQRVHVEGRGFTSQEEVRREAAAARRVSGDFIKTAYPYRPNLLGMQEQLMRTGERRPLQLTVHRLDNAKGNTKLIIKAISPQSYVRHEVDVILPGREQFELVVNADRNFWDHDLKRRSVDLRPLPNRMMSYSFGVSNVTKVAKKIDVRFWAASQVPSNVNAFPTPSGPVDRAAANEFSQAYGLKQLGPTMPRDLPASSEPVPIQLAAANPMDQPEPGANLLVPNGVSPENFVGVPLPLGLYVSFEDQEKVTFQRIDISPKRPRTYLQAVAQFDPGAGKLTIQVTAPNPTVLPAEGLQLKANFGPGWADRLRHDDSAVLTAASNPATLHAIYAPNGPPEIRATIDVDGYPRAFIFRVPRNTPAIDIQPSLVEREVRITEPAPGATFGKTRFVPTRVEVDGPEDAIVEVGIDQNHDRFLDGDPKTSRKSDRQVIIVANSLTPDGTLQLYPRVSDFEVEVPTGDEHLQANLVARLDTDAADVWSQGVPIVLDTVGPALQVALGTGRQAEVESEIEVLVWTHEPELSGIQTVEAVIEPSTAPAVEKDKKPWVAGKPRADGRWVVRLKAEKLEPGPHVILVRATDRVGNSSEAKPQEVTIIPKQIPRQLSEEEKKEQEANTVSGLVIYGNEPIDDATVELEPSPGPQAANVKTDSNGQFTIAKVPPGKYTLKARGLARGGWRRAQAEIEVRPRGMGPMEVKLDATPR